MNRPIEDYTLDTIDRRATLRERLARIPRFDRVIVLCVALGCKRKTIAGVLGVSHQCLDQIIKRSLVRMEEGPGARRRGSDGRNRW